MTIAIQETDHRRSLLLEKGADLLLRSGYEGAEVSDLVRAARLSERDFYQLFSSKEQFASEVLEAYTQQNIDFSRRLLGNKAVPAVKRLLKFYEANIRTVTVLLDFERGCLLSKIGQEMAFKCPLLANSVRENLERLRQEIEQVLEEARQNGEIAAEHDLQQLAQFIDSSWRGALLSANMSGEDAPLFAFRRYLERVLA
ncbi:MAG: TetR family transcriptional regulator C-terminal domain-containing protein [Saprospiraceae bacterium]|nr:TetR family transcriptional regulator C-terminal domain-containing protein [Saprospiraceae bacterium]MCB0624936.1 TetR family transcriptional regulator C-terminal domain-containing protein [Saprospiraceae bacterium]MCB0676795.1 TetR family transcriptional regulator C-terminal domain-containing protein [Saprospiraceae bacterium]MCB0680227.1 TetR family transcriptional regulator C-terminal domain-containing protein [Saprospiraceae bacterium]